MPATEGQFGRLLEPGVRKIFFGTYREKKEQYSQVVKTPTSKKAIETDYRFGGLGKWNQKATLESTEYDSPTNGQLITYQHVTFSRGFQVEKELYDDDQYNTINKLPQSLARAARATIEGIGVRPYQYAFVTHNTLVGSSANYDGVALCSNAHPRLDGGVNISNLASGALNEDNLKLALLLGAQQVDDRGILVQCDYKILAVPRALEFVAKQVIKSAMSTSTTYVNSSTTAGFQPNAINPIQDSVRVVVLDYLLPLNKNTNLPFNPETDTLSDMVYPWFIIDPTVAEVNYFWREKLNFKGMNDFDTDIAKYKGRFRCSVGYSDFRGVVGSPGH